MNLKFKNTILVILSLFTTVATAQTTLFTGSSDEIPTRIPAIVQTSNNDILVFADKRHDGGDIGQNGSSKTRIDIMCRRSSDNGTSWLSETCIIQGENNYGYGDVAVVADRENPANIVFFCAAGNTFFTKGQLKCHRFRSTDGGNNWTSSESSEVTTPIYKALNNQYTSAFFSSGRICQSSRIKVGTHYRLYAALCVTGTNSVVLYSDDFGESWYQLGSVAANGGDEAKCVELPNGNVLVSSKGKGKRYFNVFKYENNVLPTTINTANGDWTGMVEGCTSSDNAGTNGELLLVPASKKGQNCYLVMQTIPASSSKASNRSEVTVYWKELDTDDLNDASQYSDKWSNTYSLSTKTSSYSTMIQLADGSIAFAYEENYESYYNFWSGKTGTWDSYDIQYKNLKISDIAKDYTLPVDETPDPIDPTFTLSATSETLTVGETLMLTTETNSDGTVSYSSSNTAVATVDESGNVTAKAAGTATITASVPKTDKYNAASATCTIKVNLANPTFTISATSATLTAGETLKLTTETNSDGTVSYSSSNTAVATVDATSGNVTAKAAGTATITASVTKTDKFNAASATCTIKVNLANPTFTLSATSATLTAGETLKLTTTTNSDGTVSYSSSNPAVATVDATSGNVTAIAAGTATITASVPKTDKYNAASATCTITVKAATVVPDPEPEPDPTPETTSITITATSGEIASYAYYAATFSHEKAMTVPSGVKAYYVKASGEDAISLTQVPYGQAIPAGQGVLLISTNVSSMTLTEATENEASLTGNLLMPILSQESVTFGANDYVLVKRNGEFVFAKASGSTVQNYKNHAYLRLNSNQANVRMIFDDNDATGISGIETDEQDAIYYDLMGRRVTNPTKGIYIKNGKKVLFR